MAKLLSQKIRRASFDTIKKTTRSSNVNSIEKKNKLKRKNQTKS